VNFLHPRSSKPKHQHQQQPQRGHTGPLQFGGC
jgi:hypothetical protein